MSTTRTETGYSFDNADPEAGAQMNTLESFLDPITAHRLTPLLAPGANCWEIGAGAGSVARLMSRVVGPAGRIFATDIDLSHLASEGNITAARHDVRGELPASAPFDLIHARLVLLHVPERRQILQRLAEALTPGGWLVVEEFDCTAPLRVLTAPSDDAAKLFQQVMDTVLGILRDRGADLAWAQAAHAEMAIAGLTDIDTVTHSESWVGGSAGACLHEINSRQLEPKLLDRGLTPDQLRMFRELAHDPRFASLSYQFVSTRGRKPTRA